MKDPSVSIYDANKPWGSMKWPFALAGVAVVGTLIIVAVVTNGERAKAQTTLLALAAAWAILAPIWFLIEYHYFYRRAPGTPTDDTWELFKHGQQLAVAVWAGVTAALYGIGNSDLAKPDAKGVQCVCEIAAAASAPVLEKLIGIKPPK